RRPAVAEDRVSTAPVRAATGRTENSRAPGAPDVDAHATDTTGGPAVDTTATTSPTSASSANGTGNDVVPASKATGTGVAPTKPAESGRPGRRGGTRFGGGSGGVRARLARLGRPQQTNPVLEPLMRIVRATHPKADLALIEKAYRTA